MLGASSTVPSCRFERGEQRLLAFAVAAQSSEDDLARPAVLCDDARGFHVTLDIGQSVEHVVASEPFGEHSARTNAIEQRQDGRIGPDGRLDACDSVLSVVRLDSEEDQVWMLPRLRRVGGAGGNCEGAAVGGLDGQAAALDRVEVRASRHDAELMPGAREQTPEVTPDALPRP